MICSWIRRAREPGACPTVRRPDLGALVRVHESIREPIEGSVLGRSRVLSLVHPTRSWAVPLPRSHGRRDQAVGRPVRNEPRRYRPVEGPPVQAVHPGDSPLKLSARISSAAPTSSGHGRPDTLTRCPTPRRCRHPPGGGPPTPGRTASAAGRERRTQDQARPGPLPEFQSPLGTSHGDAQARRASSTRPARSLDLARAPRTPRGRSRPDRPRASLPVLRAGAGVHRGAGGRATRLRPGPVLRPPHRQEGLRLSSL